MGSKVRTSYGEGPQKAVPGCQGRTLQEERASRGGERTRRESDVGAAL